MIVIALMTGALADAGFYVWGTDKLPYGPVELPTLVTWVKDQRVTAETWVFATQSGSWQEAGKVPELQLFFKSRSPAASASGEPSTAVNTRTVRRIKILATLSDAQLAVFCKYVHLEQIPPWKVLVKQGDIGDSMYMILQGELRVRVMISEKETTLATLSEGDFFGDISLFDHGPRSADVIANTDSTLLKLGSADFQKLCTEAPDVAAPLLVSIGRTLTARIRADNKRYGDSIKWFHAGS
jgi:hypothetical protein